jgi:hypothetical protein
MLELLESAVLREQHGDVSQADVDEEPLTRWQRDHTEDPTLHTGASMLDGLSRRLEIEHSERTAYLCGYLCGQLQPSYRGYPVAKRVFQLERALIREGAVAPAGPRVTRVRTTVGATSAGPTAQAWSVGSSHPAVGIECKSRESESCGQQ